MYMLSQSTAINNVINCINYVTKFALFQQTIKNNVLYQKNAYKIIIEINCQLNTAFNTYCCCCHLAVLCDIK